MSTETYYIFCDGQNPKPFPSLKAAEDWIRKEAIDDFRNSGHDDESLDDMDLSDWCSAWTIAKRIKDVRPVLSVSVSAKLTTPAK